MKKKGNLDFHLEQALTFRRLFLDLLNETFIPPNKSGVKHHNTNPIPTNK